MCPDIMILVIQFRNASRKWGIALVMNKKKNSYIGFFLRISVCFLLICSVMISGCTPEVSSQEGDIITQKIISADRTPITVLVKHAFSINTFEKIIEEKFPEIDIVQVGNHVRDMGISEYSSRLEHDDLTDIVMTWPLDVGQEYWDERLIDLSGFSFTNNYNLSMLNDISREGKLYYIPGPAQVRGIIYNKTLFEEKNWQLPSNYDEFIELCKTIEASGMRSLQLGLGNAEVLDTAFVGYSYGECYSTPKGAQWISDYNRGNGKFAENFTPALETFQDLIDNGILKKSDLDITYSEREKMIFSRECAMIEDSVLLARAEYSKTGTTDEYALMPFFNPGERGDWARLYMVCYVGLNKNLLQPENKEKYDIVLKLMEYISTPEGQEALMSDTGAMFSSLIGTAPPNEPETSALIDALENGRYAIFPQLQNAQQALREGLAGMVRGDMTIDDVCKMVDKQNASPPTASAPIVLGTATEDFSIKETGAFVADCMKAESGCDIALILDNGKDGVTNGKGISARIYNGDVTDVDIWRILPDIRYGDTDKIWKISITGENLMKTLEYSVAENSELTGCFYYFSGLKLNYDVTAAPGSRIKSITTDSGQSIDPNKEYTVAIMGGTVSEEYLISCEKTTRSIYDILKDAISTKKTISPVKDGRFLTN